MCIPSYQELSRFYYFLKFLKNIFSKNAINVPECVLILIEANYNYNNNIIKNIGTELLLRNYI